MTLKQLTLLISLAALPALSLHAENKNLVDKTGYSPQLKACYERCDAKKDPEANELCRSTCWQDDQKRKQASQSAVEANKRK